MSRLVGIVVHVYEAWGCDSHHTSSLRMKLVKEEIRTKSMTENRVEPVLNHTFLFPC